jgi:XXXCH domain-containing protein
MAERDKVDQWKLSMKSVKKELSTAFEKLNQEVKTSGLPSDKTLKQLNDSSVAMKNLADPEWSDAMDIYMDHLENLNHAAISGQKEVVLHKVSDLRNYMRSCHKEFK